MDIYPPSKQRPALLALLTALNASPKTLRRDDCGDWQILGTRGHIYAIPGTLTEPGREGFHIFIMGWSSRGWNAARSEIGKFASVTNDGDDEGALFLARLPTASEAEVIRKWCGIPKKRDVSDETLDRLRQFSFPAENCPAQEAS